MVMVAEIKNINLIKLIEYFDLLKITDFTSYFWHISIF